MCSDPYQYGVILRSLPGDWHGTYAKGFELAEASRPVSDRFALYHRASSFVAGTLEDTRCLAECFRLLGRAVGSDLLAEVDPDLPPAQRIGLCLQRAHQRHERSPEHERLLPPAEALRPLAGAVVGALGSCASTQDHDLWRAIPSLAALAHVAPALGVVERLRIGIAQRMQGRLDQAVQTYEDVLKLLAEPDGGGLEPTYRSYTEAGVRCVTATLEELKAQGAGALLSGLAHEAAARVALFERDAEVFELHLEVVERCFLQHGHRGLAAKYSRLVEDAVDAGLRESLAQEGAPTDGSVVAISTVLSTCGDGFARAQLALELLMQTSGADSGALFALGSDGPFLAARQGEGLDETQLQEVARGRLQEVWTTQLKLECTVTQDLDEAGKKSPNAADAFMLDDHHELRLMLVAHADQDGFHVTGLAAFRMEAPRQFVPPMDLGAQLSRYWLDMGDAQALGTSTGWT